MEFKHLEKWKNTLDGCIRCGYCYEHCPVFKHTRWESDSPRAKLIMLYGLLSGKLEPSSYISEKLFSCFYCGRCTAACSSGVPLTDIFTDARADFAGTEFETRGTTSVTGWECGLCLTCVRACPHEARTYEGDKIVTDPVKCQSCGICVDLCPNQTAQAGMGFGTDRAYLTREIRDFMAADASKAIIFGCNWSIYPDLQNAYIAQHERPVPEHKILINMCGGRLEKPLLLEPFLNQAWGVLVACCPDGECDHNGNEKAKSHVKELKALMQELGIESERLQLVQIAHGDKAGFQKSITAFMVDIASLGPLK